MLGALAAVYLLAAPLSAAGQAPSQPAPAAPADCAGCHAALLAEGKAHKPAKDGNCTTCHLAAPGAGKCQSPQSSAWKLVADQPALCTKCHDVSGATPLHPVIKSSGCVACHNPHASKNPKLLKRFPVDALCYSCHAKFDDAEFVHGAVKQGKCLGCHNPHSGEAKPLLTDQREGLCFECHKKEQMANGESLHAPVVSGKCLACHDPHRGDYPAQTVEKGNKLCLSCHDASKPKSRKVVDLAQKNVHQPLKSGECLSCHKPHASDNGRLLKAALPGLCFQCHKRNDESKFVHGAVKVGDCPVCHQAHSSPNPTLLAESSSAALCFRCHADDITGRAFVHKPVGEGKCLDCHQSHGADHRFNLKNGPRAAACVSCHKGKGEGKVKHAVLETYGCTACHDPHASGNGFQLIKPVNELCQTCHADKKDGAHITTFAAGGHPVSGDWDPRRKDRSFSCASCHDPHGSDNPRLFYFGKDSFEMCASCHGDKTGAHPELKDIHRPPPKRPPVASAPEAKP